jgi:hypothetical protein
MQPILLRPRHRFPPDVIRHAVWLYLRFTLSYRDVEDLLAQRGLMVSNESIRRWVLKFGPIIAKNLREICGAHADLIGRECLQQLFLFGCRGRVDPLVEGQSSAISREIGNLTPADVYFGRGQTILIEGVVKGGSTMTQGVALVAVTDAVTALAERVNVDVGLVIAPELREVTGNVL